MMISQLQSPILINLSLNFFPLIIGTNSLIKSMQDRRSDLLDINNLKDFISDLQKSSIIDLSAWRRIKTSLVQNDNIEGIVFQDVGENFDNLGWKFEVIIVCVEMF